MSRFHQLSAGKIGSGPGMTPPSVSIAATRPPRAAIDMTVASRARPRGRGIAWQERKNRAAANPSLFGRPLRHSLTDLSNALAVPCASPQRMRSRLPARVKQARTGRRPDHPAGSGTRVKLDRRRRHRVPDLPGRPRARAGAQIGWSPGLSAARCRENAAGVSARSPVPASSSAPRSGYNREDGRQRRVSCRHRIEEAR
jgi:hypothetical protein